MDKNIPVGMRDTIAVVEVVDDTGMMHVPRINVAEARVRRASKTVGIFHSITSIIQNTIWIYYLCKFGNCRDRRGMRP